MSGEILPVVEILLRLQAEEMGGHQQDVMLAII